MDFQLESRTHHAPDGGRTLLVLRDGFARSLPLPRTGVVVLGGGADCDVVVEDLPSETRLLLLLGGDLVLQAASLDQRRSRDEAPIGHVGERALSVGQECRLEPGQVVTIGSSTLVVHVSRSGTRVRFLRTLPELHERAEQARSVGLDPVLLAVSCQAGALEQVGEVLERRLGERDVVAQAGPDDLRVLLLDRSVMEARRLAQSVALDLGPLVKEVSALGPASAPGGATALPFRSMLEIVAQSSINVLILGETGVGKEIAAARLHERSRRTGPLVSINCGALNESLLESELFGHEKGAFTGSSGRRIGLIESADGGTLFLDEAGEMPARLQSRLLRVLEQRTVTRLGAVRPVPVDVRFVAATNRDLEQAVREGSFREDLYYRLAAATITVPPLRERPGEILSLAREFLDAWCNREGARACPMLAPDAESWLLSHSYPGNCRELKNIVEHAALVAVGGPITAEHLPHPRPRSTPPPPNEPRANEPREPRANEPRANEPRVNESRVSARESRAPLLEPVSDARLGATLAPRPAPVASPPSERPPQDRLGPDERERIIEALEQCAWNQTQAAKRLGISRRTLIKRIELYALPRPRKSSIPG